jgi:hypothetical protein
MLAAAEDLFVQVAHPRHAVDDGRSGQVARVEAAVELVPANWRRDRGSGFRANGVGGDDLLAVPVHLRVDVNPLPLLRSRLERDRAGSDLGDG